MMDSGILTVNMFEWKLFIHFGEVERLSLWLLPLKMRAEEQEIFMSQRPDVYSDYGLIAAQMSTV